MALGPGKYDAVCTVARDLAAAEGVLLIVLNGKLGSGFSVQGAPEIMGEIPRLLRQMADQIDQTFAEAILRASRRGPSC
jgi:hypothetical protein